MMDRPPMAADRFYRLGGSVVIIVVLSAIFFH